MQDSNSYKIKSPHLINTSIAVYPESFFFNLKLNIRIQLIKTKRKYVYVLAPRAPAPTDSAAP
jgi:hypothetical protein